MQKLPVEEELSRVGMSTRMWVGVRQTRKFERLVKCQTRENHARGAGLRLSLFLFLFLGLKSFIAERSFYDLPSTGASIAFAHAES